ncbi:MAG: hypothetical protein Tsb009_02720 [Planctomycetaceae bacterium]
MRTPSHLRLQYCCALFVVSLSAVSLTGCNQMSSRQANLNGRIYYATGNYTAAAREFNRATIDDPRNPDYAYNLAAARKKQGRIAEAERAYRQALHLKPTHQPSYHGLASLLKEQNRLAEAQQLLQSWVAIEPYKAEPYVELAWLQRESGDLAGAEQTLRHALAKQPNHATALAHLGQIYQDKGQTAQAMAMYRRSLHRRWFQPEVHSRIASLEEQQNVNRSIQARFANQQMVPYNSYVNPQFAAEQSGTQQPMPAAKGPVASNPDPAHLK